MQIIDLKGLDSKMDQILEGQKQLREAGVPKQETKALNESMAKQKKDYKEIVAKAFRETKDDMDPDRNIAQMFSEAIGNVDGAAAIPNIWADDVMRCCPYPASAFLNAPFVKWHNDIKNAPGGTVYVVTVGRATGGSEECEEPTTVAPTIANVPIGLTDYKCAVDICKDDLEDMIPDTITEINNSLVNCLDEWIDNYFIAGILGLGSTLVKGTLNFSAAIIAEAIGTMRSGTCPPVALIIHPAVEARLMQDSQFVNAATYGDNSVITDGHIIHYLGLEIVVVPKGSLFPGVGTYKSLLLSRYAVHAAMKRDPTIESQYSVKEQMRTVMASTRLGKSVVCNSGVLWISSAA